MSFCSWPRRAMLALVAVGCVACARHEADPPAPLRPVKVERVHTAAAQPLETFIGTLRAHERADLSFESPGRVAAVLVEVGDRVKAGRLLATLDPMPAQKRLEKAQADRAAAAAALAERTTQWREQSALADEHIVSQALLETVRSQREAAVAQLEAADAGLALARRDLAMARITAPFDGEIVARAVQPHVDVPAGQMVIQIESSGRLEVVAMLPEGVAARLAAGQSATAVLGAEGQGGRRVALTLEKLSSRSESGSLVQALFRVAGTAPGLRSGSVVSVDLPGAGGPAMSLPAPAVLPGPQRGTGNVFVLDETHARVARRAVRLGETLLPDGRLQVLEGLSAGEKVVVAGAAFLTDGQAAMAHEAQTQLLDGAR